MNFHLGRSAAGALVFAVALATAAGFSGRAALELATESRLAHTLYPYEQEHLLCG